MIYIHIPYCHRKCTYCAFFSAVTAADKQHYVDALCQELELRHEEMPAPIRTIYLGGGTPSILTMSQLRQIVTTIRHHYSIDSLEEVTLEANPEDLTPEYLEQLQSLDFFNRISIGVQSFSDSDLRILNRRHSAQQSLDAVRNAQAAGFNNISIDLIYGLPNQDTTAWQHNLDMLEMIPITHLSAYALTVEEGTMLYQQIDQGRMTPADEATVINQYQALIDKTRIMGFEQYEISNFARPRFRSRHNSRYWDRTPYLGAGASAHSFDGKHRRWNIANTERYISEMGSGNSYFEQETLTAADAHNEYLMTALRTVCGIEKNRVQPRYFAQLEQAIVPYLRAGFVEDTGTHFRPTSDGLLHADGIAAALFVDK